ncbi:MAG: 3-phenylpropionate MFS transporter [Alphaproteobacteria bacterium]|nr:3-phenylpropionate MFS transporter [Alphaproteobacteria bacterium]
MASSDPPQAAALSDSSVGVRLSLFYIFFFINAGIYMPFWPVWLESRGLGPVEIGLLIAVGRFARVISSPLIAYGADRRGNRRAPLLILTGTTTVIFLLYLYCDPVWQYAAVAAAVGAAWGTIMPLGDSLAIVNTQTRSIQYGRVRLWGSVSFILATLAGGKMLEFWPESAIFWVLMVSFVSLFVVCLILPDTRVEPAPIRMSGIWRLFVHPLFALFMLCSALLQTSHLVVYIFGTLHWRASGVSDGMIGVLWAIGVVAEIALFAVGRQFVMRFGPGWLFVIAALAGVVRWTMLADSTAVPVLIAVQTLHGLTFGAAHLAAMAFIADAIPARLSATAQSLHGSVALSVAAGVVAPIIGPLYEEYGGGAFHAMTILSLAGGICGILLQRRWQGRLIVD